MNAEKIITDLNLSANDAKTLTNYEGRIGSADPIAVHQEIDRLIESDEYRDPSLGQQLIASAMLLVATSALSGVSETVSSLPAGVREAADLLDEAPHHAKLEQVEAHILSLENEGITSGEHYDRYQNMKTDINTSLREAGTLRDIVDEQKEKQDQINLDAETKYAAEEKDELVGRLTNSNLRMRMTPEKAKAEAEKEADRILKRNRQGY